MRTWKRRFEASRHRSFNHLAALSHVGKGWKEGGGGGSGGETELGEGGKSGDGVGGEGHREEGDGERKLEEAEEEEEKEKRQGKERTGEREEEGGKARGVRWRKGDFSVNVNGKNKEGQRDDFFIDEGMLTGFCLGVYLGVLDTLCFSCLCVLLMSKMADKEFFVFSRAFIHQHRTKRVVIAIFLSSL